ncbi:MAG: hypothetical protein ACLTYN_13425 [Dysosmobacter welbionis]
MTDGVVAFDHDSLLIHCKAATNMLSSVPRALPTIPLRSGLSFQETLPPKTQLRRGGDGGGDRR